MKDFLDVKHSGSSGVALIGLAIGAVAVGGFAVGAFVIGRLVIRRVSIESAKFKSLQIQDLTVTRLRAAELVVSDSLKLPESSIDGGISAKNARLSRIDVTHRVRI